MKNGIIEQIRIFGDYFGVGEVGELEEKLRGVRYERESIQQALADVNVSHYLGKIEKDDFIDLMY